MAREGYPPNDSCILPVHLCNAHVQQQLHHASAGVRVISGSISILAEELASLSLTEQEILHLLAKGRGITQHDGIGVLESWGSCRLMFTLAASTLQAHIPVCSES
ncbi:hypothetical protein F4604DRAFT_1675932 [Suillus subluteus]|nr:hypothetical protein F4604DRAFT_1675932 [Suillus subluteus]